MSPFAGDIALGFALNVVVGEGQVNRRRTADSTSRAGGCRALVATSAPFNPW